MWTTFACTVYWTLKHKGQRKMISENLSFVIVTVKRELEKDTITCSFDQKH